MEPNTTLPLPIAAVERETGLTKDVLRKWETRYGFPVPLRDGQGERLYPPEQVDRLRIIKRLMDTGMRPSSIVSESAERLTELALNSEAGVQSESSQEVANATLILLREEDPSRLRQRLQRELLRLGVERFVQDTLAPLNQTVGNAWARGEIGVHEEHVYTEAVQWVLRNTIASLSDAGGTPRVLLTTLPEEQHGLGILMVAALLSLHGAYCISLGTQTPVQDIVRAARAHEADVVVLSFSNTYPKRRILPALAELNQHLGDGTEVWAGGSGTARLRSPDQSLMPTLELALTALAEWRARHGGAEPG
jgi:methanogenic corrinoid protein MtbC1